MQYASEAQDRNKTLVTQVLMAVNGSLSITFGYIRKDTKLCAELDIGLLVPKMSVCAEYTDTHYWYVLPCYCCPSLLLLCPSQAETVRRLLEKQTTKKKEEEKVSSNALISIILLCPKTHC